MPYTFNLPGFFNSQNLDDYGRLLLRKGFGGLPGMRGGRGGLPPVANDLINQLFPSGFGGPSKPSPPPPRPRPPRDTRDTGSIGGFSNISGRDSTGHGSISSLPKFKEAAGKAATLVYRDEDFSSKRGWTKSGATTIATLGCIVIVVIVIIIRQMAHKRGHKVMKPSGRRS